RAAHVIVRGPPSSALACTTDAPEPPRPAAQPRRPPGGSPREGRRVDYLAPGVNFARAMDDAFRAAVNLRLARDTTTGGADESNPARRTPTAVAMRTGGWFQESGSARALESGCRSLAETCLATVQAAQGPAESRYRPHSRLPPRPQASIRC